jgi:hypothetical protein
MYWRLCGPSVAAEHLRTLTGRPTPVQVPIDIFPSIRFAAIFLHHPRQIPYGIIKAT